MESVALREKDLAVLRTIFRRFQSVREVRVFGSRATGQARRASDLDLAITTACPNPREWADLCEALETAPLIYELDLIRRETGVHSRLEEKIVREGITIYP
jgi:hypothetical protein